MILCDDPMCTNETHTNTIERMYSDITSALMEPGEPFCIKHKHEHCYAMGWNEYCKIAHEEARAAYILWCENRRIRQEFLFDYMKRTQAYFKCVLRKCKSIDSKKIAHFLANTLLTKDDKMLWKAVKHVNSDRCSATSTITDVSGSNTITDMLNNSDMTCFRFSIDNMID